MIDGDARRDEVEQLDAVWDDLVLGASDPARRIDGDDQAVLRFLVAVPAVPVAAARRVWNLAWGVVHGQPRIVASVRPAPGKGSLSLTATGPGWFPAGLLTIVIALAMLGGMVFGDRGAPEQATGLPGYASSVVATLAPTAPAGATPGGEGTTLEQPIDEENG